MQEAKCCYEIELMETNTSSSSQSVINLVSNKPILFYDGDCGLCHRFVKFVLKHEEEALFLFAPLYGETFKEYIDERIALGLPDSLVLITANREMLILSNAAVYAMKTLSPAWRRVGTCIGVLPKPVRDFGYRCVAAIRKKIFRKPEGVCPIVPPEMRARILL